MIGCLFCGMPISSKEDAIYVVRKAQQVVESKTSPIHIKCVQAFPYSMARIKIKNVIFDHKGNKI